MQEEEKLTRGKAGNLVEMQDGKEKPLDPSSFFPDEPTRNRLAQVLRDYQYATLIFNRSRPEFNDRSIRNEIDVNERAFNSYVPPRSEDPDESWRAQTVRPITRNKLISIAAHVTATILYPNVFAVDEKNDEQKEAAIVMRDLIEWVIDNSNYSETFLLAVITALVDPASIVHVEYAKVMRNVKEMQDDGKYSVKEIVDEVLSGFQFMMLRCNELLIANIYEPNIQKQRYLIKNKFVDYEEEKLIYADNQNFKDYVRPGVRIIFDQSTNTFYQMYDKELQQNFVHEVTYYNRALDLELRYINGIPMDDAERPNPRKDKLYPFAKTGYEPINNGQFFYYKSAANKLGSDQEIVDTLYNMVIDGTFLALMPPIALYGSEEVNSGVTVPGAVTAFRDPNVKMENMAPRSDIRAGLEMISTVERSISESSQDNIRAGVSDGGPAKTAREVLIMEQNAKTALGLFGKMIAAFVKDIGKLMIGDILQHMTVGEVKDITGKDTSLKFKSFLLNNKNVEGKNVTKKIMFQGDYVGKEFSPTELEEESFNILEKEGGIKSDMKLYMVNPEIFRQTKYFIKVNADDLTPKTKSIEQALKLEAYDRMIQNPVLDQEAVARDFLVEAVAPGKADKYFKKQVPQDPNAMSGGVNPAMNPKGVNQNMTSQLTGSNSLASKLGMM